MSLEVKMQQKRYKWWIYRWTYKKKGMNNVFTGENPTTNVFIGQNAADKILLH